MKNYSWFSSIFLSVVLVSCGSSSEEVKSEENSIQECYYTYNSANTQLTWTAFKFNEKTPVSGSFNEINIEGAETLNDPIEIIKRLSFSIPVASINSQNPERDEKIKQSFFGVLQNTQLLTGQVISVSADKVVFSLKLNNIEKQVECDYTLSENLFKLTTTLDLTIFDATNAVASLNKVCEDLHIGADGVSKLWDVVDLSFETTFNSDCQ